MTLEAGTTLGHYEVLSSLGAGGMGEVYRARDTRLGREVAIKVLPEILSHDREFRQRLEREAKTISQLQHPHICTLFDVGSENGVDFLVMEYLEGETLEERLEKGALPIAQVLEIGSQIAEAIDSAHKARVVHRDLKPGNVMLTKTGIKVLDFGLAKSIEPGPLPVNTQSPTMMQPITGQGSILGTPLYMAPEQLEGKDTDARTDIWALGCVLYEMVTGERPFQGDSQASLITAIMASEPRPLSVVEEIAPPRLDWVVSRCLTKDPERRWQSARDVSIELEAIGKIADQPSSKPVEVDGPSIVVLPFANTSSDPEQEYFCDGMAEEVINLLTQLEGLHVVARTSAFSFKGRDIDVREIGEKLGVRSVLEGSVRKAGDQLRITAELVNVADGYHLWSERFDRQLDDVFAIQDEIAASIVETLKVKLAVGGTPPKTGNRTENREVYDLYLRGLYYQGLATERGYNKSIECLEQALVLDPEYAAAYAVLSRGYMLLNTYGFSTAEQALPKAEAAAIRAVELDDSLARAHHALGMVRASLHWDWMGAEKEFRWAIDLKPGLAGARYSYALRVLSTSGRTREAVAETRRAHDIDPLSLLMNRGLGETLYWDRQYHEAIRQFRHTLDLAPDFFLTRNLLAAAYASNDQPEEAFRERREILRRAGRGNEVEALEAAWAEGGEPGMLRWYIQRGLRKAEKAKTEGGGANRAWSMALLHGRLGEAGEALDWLEEAVHQHGGLVILAQVDPWLDSLRSDPRYHAILKTLNLAD